MTEPLGATEVDRPDPELAGAVGVRGVAISGTVRFSFPYICTPERPASRLLEEGVTELTPEGVLPEDEAGAETGPVTRPDSVRDLGSEDAGGVLTEVEGEPLVTVERVDGTTGVRPPLT